MKRALTFGLVLLATAASAADIALATRHIELRALDVVEDFEYQDVLGRLTHYTRTYPSPSGLQSLSPPESEPTPITGITGDQGPTR